MNRVIEDFVESLVAREIEKAWREGWSAGYSAGLREDTENGFYWCDQDLDWSESEARAALNPRQNEEEGE